MIKLVFLNNYEKKGKILYFTKNAYYMIYKMYNYGNLLLIINLIIIN